MSNFRNTNDLKKDALERAGELTDGTSFFNTRATKYLNNAYQELFAGGSIFGIDVDEAWAWAKADRPIILTLEPAYETGTVTLTLGSTDGTFSVAPAASQQGRFLKIEARDEYFRIRAHNAGASAFELDQLYTEASGTFNFKSIQLEYDLFDNEIVVDENSNVIPFRDVASIRLTATLAEGVYSPTEFAAEAKSKMEAVGIGIYTVTFNTFTRKFSFATNQAALFFDFASGSSIERSLGPEIGFDATDLSGATSYTGQTPINAIYRLFSPMVVYRDHINDGFLFDGITRACDRELRSGQGNISGIPYATMLTSHPLTRLIQGTPDRFAEADISESGFARVRFNRFPSRKTRVEVEYIPVPQDLYDNTTSTPKIPRAFRPYLVHAAAYYLMLDKSDNRAQMEASHAQAKLSAMIKANRSTVKLSGQNYGRLIPRRS